MTCTQCAMTGQQSVQGFVILALSRAACAVLTGTFLVSKPRRSGCAPWQTSPPGTQEVHQQAACFFNLDADSMACIRCRLQISTS